MTKIQLSAANQVSQIVNATYRAKEQLLLFCFKGQLENSRFKKKKKIQDLVGFYLSSGEKKKKEDKIITNKGTLIHR